jgi:hypothetical protein
MAIRNRTKGEKMIYNILHRKLKTKNANPTVISSEPRWCFGRSVLRLTACDYLFGIFKLIFTNPITIYSIENEKSITTQKTCNQTNNSNPKTPVKD